MDCSVFQWQRPVITGWPAFAGHDTPMVFAETAARPVPFGDVIYDEKDIYESP